MNKFLAVPLALALGACSLTPDYQRPAAPVPAQWSAEPAAAGVKPPQLEWQTLFPDPRLQALIAAALEHNRDLALATARVEEARALYGIARADRLPTVNLAASRAASRTPADLAMTGRPLNAQRYDADFAVAAFEVDFWGRVASLGEAAKAAYLATEEARRAFRLTLVADVANAYLTLLEMQERQAIAVDTARTREETRSLIAKRRDVGLSSDLDLLQADGALQAARAEAANLARQRAAAENALRLLVGASPGLPAGRALADQGIVADVPDGLSSELLVQRPDVLAAEQRLIAANANVGAARAAFLPRLALTATLGTASKALAGLFDAGSGAWAFQPALSYPLFDAGRSAANQDLAEARKIIAVADYEKTLQQAFREVADLLAAREQLAIQLAALDAAAKTQAERLKLADARYQAGIASYLEVLDAQRESFAARQNAVQTRRALLGAAAQLYKALGGSR
ncbi:MAG: efflux transporter outer membrane subunit [Rhodocyclales bacterium]|nr:efflux transporter outer membrane subunit [Rhodocyclales bacterium]